MVFHGAEWVKGFCRGMKPCSMGFCCEINFCMPGRAYELEGGAELVRSQSRLRYAQSSHIRIDPHQVDTVTM